MKEEFNLGPYFFSFYSKTDELDSSLEQYNKASVSYKETFNDFINGEASAQEVRDEMRKVAFSDQQLIGTGLYLKKHVEEGYGEFPDFELEDVVAACTETTVARQKTAEEKSSYRPSDTDFVDAVTAVERNSRAILEPEDEMVTETQVQEAINYTWRDAFSDISFQETPGFNVSDERPENRREDVLGLEKGDLEERRQDVKDKEPRYIH